MDVLQLDSMTDGVIDLRLTEFTPPLESSYSAPTWRYDIYERGRTVSAGHITLRTGRNEVIKYAGHIGYEVLPKWRGHGYAYRACRLIAPLSKALGLDAPIITCDVDNMPSIRTIEKLGGRYVETLSVPRSNAAYAYGMRVKRIYVCDVGKEELDAQSFMRMALWAARLGKAAAEVPVGALVVKKGVIVSWAHNSREKTRLPDGHAEFTAMRLAAQKLGDWRLVDCTLYVTLEPCAMCAGAIINARMPRVVFGAFDSACGCCGSVYDLLGGRLGHTPQVIGGVLEKECAAVLKRTFMDFRRLV